MWLAAAAIIFFLCSEGVSGLEIISVYAGESVRFGCDDVSMSLENKHAVEMLLMEGQRVIFEYEEGFQRKTNRTNLWHFDAMGMERDKVGQGFHIDVRIPRARVADSGKYSCLVRYWESNSDKKKKVDVADLTVYEDDEVVESSEPRPLLIPDPFDPWASERYSITVSSVFGMAFFVLVCVLISQTLVLMVLPKSIIIRFLRLFLRYMATDVDLEPEAETDADDEQTETDTSFGFIPPAPSERTSKGNLVVVMDDSFMGSFSLVQ